VSAAILPVIGVGPQPGGVHATTCVRSRAATGVGARPSSPLGGCADACAGHAYGRRHSRGPSRRRSSARGTPCTRLPQSPPCPCNAKPSCLCASPRSDRGSGTPNANGCRRRWPIVPGRWGLRRSTSSTRLADAVQRSGPGDAKALHASWRRSRWAQSAASSVSRPRACRARLKPGVGYWSWVSWSIRCVRLRTPSLMCMRWMPNWCGASRGRCVWRSGQCCPSACHQGRQRQPGEGHGGGCYRPGTSATRVDSSFKPPSNGCHKLSSRYCGAFVTRAVSARPCPGSTAVLWPSQ
jgi:hypothetical protein